MARIVGGLGTSHIPAIGNAIARDLFDDPYWKPFFDGYPPAQQWVKEQDPDIAIVVYNDHGLNFFLDSMPTFAIGAAPEYQNADEGWGLKPLPPFPGDPEFSWHLIDSLVNDEFDICMCQEMLVDHGMTVPLSLFWPKREEMRVKTIPIAINAVQHPIPTAARCYKLGLALGKAIRSYPKDQKVVVLGTGGLSHQLDGQRAGFINKEFDEMALEKIVSDPEALTRYSIAELVELAGTQGTEIIHWLVMRGALGDDVTLLHKNYHIPISNTAAGMMVLETPSG